MVAWNCRHSIEIIPAARSGRVPKRILGPTHPFLQAKSQEVQA